MLIWELRFLTVLFPDDFLLMFFTYFLLFPSSRHLASDQFLQALLYISYPTNYGKFLEMRTPDHLTCLLRNLYAGQEAAVTTRHGTTDWFQTEKEYIKAVYCHPAYLTYVQNTSRKMLGWMKYKLESRFPGEISITSDRQMTPPLWQKAKRNYRAS